MLGERLTAGAPLVLIGVLTALTFWLDRTMQPPVRDATGASRHDPDYIVDNLTAVRMSEGGVASYTLSAAKMLHFPDDDSTQLTNPHLVSYGSPKAPMTITASEALVSADGENVYFQDNVRVTRAAYDDFSELVMRTAFLHVIPDDNIARTNRPVTITDAATEVNAVGLEVNSETHIIKLLSKVRGTYDPGKAPRREDRR